MKDLEINIKDAIISILSSYMITSFIWLAFVDTTRNLNVLEQINSLLYLLLIMIAPIAIELAIFCLIYNFAFRPYVTLVSHITISSLFFFIAGIEVKFLFFKSSCFFIVIFLLYINKKLR